MKKLISLTLVMAMILSLTACGGTGAGAGAGTTAENPTAGEEAAETADTQETAATEAAEAAETGNIAGDSTHEITSRTFPLYFDDKKMNEEQTLYFLDGVTDLPYIEANDWLTLMRSVYENPGFPVDFKMSADGSIVTYTRPSDRYDVDLPMTIDFDNDVISFQDFNLFVMKPGQSTVLDLIGMNTYDEAGNPVLLEKVDTGVFERLGDALEINLGDYGIDLIQQDGKYLIPLQTVADLIVSPVWLESIYFNGQCVMVTENAAAFPDIYYAAPTGERSDALAEYGYNELCLLLDTVYGLKDDHHIESFDQFFKEVGFQDPLKGNSAEEADKAILRLITDYMDDIHSLWRGYSYLTGPIEYTATSPSRERLGKTKKRMEETRAKYYPDGIPGYEEVGNTAYITFDDFALTMASAEDFYKVEDPMDFPDNDTIGLIMKAHSQITREGSPIENVVIDLSDNTGGVSDTAAFTMAWFLGEASIGMRDTMTGATCSSVYRCDANRDRKFDEKDTVSDKNLYCLISPVSFSCGNLVPCMFKESGVVTLLGRPSAGGACIVEHASSAWGTSFRLSGTHQLSFMKNGSFYDIDRGAEADFVLTNPDKYYDRQALTKYINSLN